MDRYTCSSASLLRSVVGGVSSVVLMLGIMMVSTGCSPKFGWAGKWVGNRNLPVKPGQNRAMVYTIGKVELNIEPSGNFTLVEGGVPKTGVANLSSKTATLEVRTFMGRPISKMGSGAEAMNKPINLKVVQGGIELEDPAGFDSQPIFLKREGAAGG